MRRPGLGLPGRQQPARAIRLVDDKVGAATMPQPTHHTDAFAGARVISIMDENIEGLLL